MSRLAESTGLPPCIEMLIGQFAGMKEVLDRGPFCLSLTEPSSDRRFPRWEQDRWGRGKGLSVGRVETELLPICQLCDLGHIIS